MPAARCRRPLHTVVAIAVSGVCTLALGAAAPAALAADTSPPTQPGPVTVSGVTATSASLAWGKSTDDVGIEGYRVYRGPADSADSALRLIATTDAVTSYKATALFSGTAYKFGIIAIDAANNLSPMRTVSVTTAASSDTTAPSAPSSSSVSGTAFSSSRLDVVWGGSTSSDVAAYQVFRNGALVGTVDRPNGLRFSDNGLVASTAYTYVIKAVDSAGNVSAGTAGRILKTLAAGALKIARGPYLSNVTGTSAVISWWTNLPTAGVVSWGAASATEHTQSDQAGSVQHHQVTIGGLAPGTTYLYQVGDGAGLVSAASFPSAAPPGQAFSFAAIGDFGGGSPGETQNASNIAGPGTSFIQTLGDNVYPSAGNPDPDFSTTYSDFDARFYKPFGAAIKRQAFFPANGNKEYYGDGVFWQNFPMPGGNHSWYSYDWGDAHIVVLDSEQPFAPGTPQFDFAQNDLAAHQNDAWRIVALQRPPYSSSTANSSSKPVQQYLVPLFQQQKVNLVLSGNSHNYERTHPLIDGVPAPGGITYVVSGAGGNGFNAFTLAAPAYSAFREDSYYEYLRVTVSPTEIRLDGIRADTNAVFDSATITRSTGAPPAPPTGLTATPVGSTEIDLSWTASSPAAGVTGYQVRRNGGAPVTVAAPATSFKDTGLTPSTAYSYSVTAVDANGTESTAATASATTGAGGATLAFVRDATGSTASGTSFAVPIASSAGDSLVASIAIGAGSTASVTSVTDSAGGSWTKGPVGFLSGSSTRVELWYRTNVPAVTSVTVNLNTAKAASADVAEFSGVAAASALDASAGNTGTASSTTASTPSITTTNANDVVVGAINYLSSSATATLAAAGWTGLSPFKVSTVNGRAAYWIVSSTGSWSASWTLSAAATSGGAILALKAA